MKTTVNCFIPFMGAAQAEQTIKNLKASDLVSKIYLLVTDNVEESYRWLVRETFGSIIEFYELPKAREIAFSFRMPDLQL